MHLRPRIEGGIVKLVASAPGRWRALDAVRSFLIRTASLFGNYRRYDSGPRVTVPLLHSGGVGVALSALYSPFDEMDLAKKYGSPPDGSYFPTLLRQLEDVETEVANEQVGRARIAHDPDELERGLAAGEAVLIHCVEGGFHLGPTPEEIDANVTELARRGCLYITLAHLFYRSVATNVNAIPFVPTGIYDRLFPMPQDAGLTDLGRAAVRAMDRERVIVDLSHMDERAIAETLDLLDELDPERETPVIASHAGYRFGHDRYNLTPPTLQRIAERDGVVGLILATHQAADGLGHPTRLEDGLAVLYRHADRIREITGSHRHTAIGTDFDGFIKPTLPGLEDEGDMHRLEDALHDRYGAEDAEAIASGNVLRLVRTYWRGGLEENPPIAPVAPARAGGLVG